MCCGADPTVGTPLKTAPPLKYQGPGYIPGLPAVDLTADETMQYVRTKEMLAAILATGVFTDATPRKAAPPAPQET